jgi:hypothetical protein
MCSTTKKREKPHWSRPREGYVMVMFDSAEYNGLGKASAEARFFEMTRKRFTREIRHNIDSFFGYPDGCPKNDAENAKSYRAMWQKLLAENEFGENGRRVVLIRGTAEIK